MNAAKKRILFWSCLSWLLGGVAASASAAGDVELLRVWPEYRADSALLRLSDYFRPPKQTPQSDYQRTAPASRAGLYFTIRLRSEDTAPLPDGIARLHVIMPDASESRLFDFPFRGRDKRNLKLELGLTGTDWTYGDMLPTAWRLEILNASGDVLASRDSFLWR